MGDTMKRRFISRIFTTAVPALLVLFGLGVMTPAARAAEVTWDDSGSTGNWSDATNWVGDVLPGTLDVATFDGATSSANCTINTAATADVAGLYIQSDYTGMLTQATA